MTGILVVALRGCRGDKASPRSKVFDRQLARIRPQMLLAPALYATMSGSAMVLAEAFDASCVALGSEQAAGRLASATVTSSTSAPGALPGRLSHAF